MDDRKLLKKAREDYVLGSDYAIRDLFDRFEQMLDDKEPKSIVWEPQEGEKYYFVGSYGHVHSHYFTDDLKDKEFLSCHNVYKTRELAVKAAQYQRRYNMVLQAVLNLEPDQVVDWSDVDQAKYTLHFNHVNGVWYITDYRKIEDGYPVLTDKKNVKPLVDYLNAKEKKNG